MSLSREIPLGRLAAVFAVVVGLAACSDADTGGAPTPDPAPAPAPAPGPAPEPAPAPAPEPAPAPAPEPGPDTDTLASLTPDAVATRAAILDAARAQDFDALGLLIQDGFSSNFAGETDHVAYYRSVGPEVFDAIIALLEDPVLVISGDVAIWPELYLREPFAFGPDERPALEERFGADALAEWERAGDYLGWRIGIALDGEWRFLVAGD